MLSAHDAGHTPEDLPTDPLVARSMSLRGAQLAPQGFGCDTKSLTESYAVTQLSAPTHTRTKRTISSIIRSQLLHQQLTVLHSSNATQDVYHKTRARPHIHIYSTRQADRSSLHGILPYRSASHVFCERPCCFNGCIVGADDGCAIFRFPSANKARLSRARPALADSTIA